MPEAALYAIVGRARAGAARLLYRQPGVHGLAAATAGLEYFNTQPELAAEWRGSLDAKFACWSRHCDRQRGSPRVQREPAQSPSAFGGYRAGTGFYSIKNSIEIAFNRFYLIRKIYLLDKN